jgi:integrin alpha FG-GAP repeat containing protein 1
MGPWYAASRLNVHKFIAFALDNFQFQPSSSIKHHSPIINIVPADFNNDGRLDLLVMSQRKDKDENVMSVYFSDTNGHFGM